MDPRGPNKFEPEHHEPFPGQTNTGHGAPGDQTNKQKQDRNATPKPPKK